VSTVYRVTVPEAAEILSITTDARCEAARGVENFAVKKGDMGPHALLEAQDPDERRSSEPAGTVGR